MNYTYDCRKREVVPVTVCIAAICENDKIVVGASDRMLTAGDIQFEPQQSKLFPITTSIVAMIAGDAAMQAEVLQEVRDEASRRIDAEPKNWLRVRDVAERHSHFFTEVRQKRAEKAILKPLGLDRLTFITYQKDMNTDFIRQLATELLNFEVPEVSTIFAGIDETGPHLYVTRNENVTCQDSVGFASIGAGYWHADSQFMFAGHTRARPLAETLLLTYSAKKHAEVAPGVGSGTDMFHIGGLGSYFTIGTHVTAKLEDIYQESRGKIYSVGLEAEGKAHQYVEEITAASVAKDQAAIPEDGGGNPPADETAVRDGATEGQPETPSGETGAG